MSEDTRTMIYALVGAVFAIYLISRRFNPIYSIPTVGGSDWPLLSYIGAIRFTKRGREVIQEGYNKYYGTTFKVPMLDQWLIVISGPQLIEEVRKRPDDELSFADAADEFVQTRYLLHHDLHDNPYHVEIIKEKLTRTLPAVLPDVIDELMVAFREHIPSKGDEWLSLNVMSLMQQVVARASNRVFVGLPLCRNEDYLDVAIRFTRDLSTTRFFVNLFPSVLKPFVSKMTTRVSRNVKVVEHHIAPLVKEREEAFKQLGEGWSDKPNDMLQWLLDEARPRNGTLEGTAQRLLLINFAAIHTSSNTISHAMFHLAERPDWAEPLRAEIEGIIREDGWTKLAMGKMWKLDSFLRESQRYNGISLTGLMRQAKKEVTLSDGTRIPNGAIVVAAARPTHRDQANYTDADAFDPFRFSNIRESRQEEALKHQFVNTSVDYISFGHGRHACPGRFFAANELKAMLAFLILNYDMKLEDGVPRPEPLFFAQAIVPAVHARVMFRKREAVATRG